MNAQRGMSLIEVLVVVAVVLMVSAMAWGLASSDRAFSLNSALTIFDAELAHAQTLAATGDGGISLTFAPANAPGKIVLSLGPQQADVPPQTLAASVVEATLGAPPFALTLDAVGHVVGPQACPAAGNYTLTFTVGPNSQTRVLPCAAVAEGPPQPPGTMPP